MPSERVLDRASYYIVKEIRSDNRPPCYFLKLKALPEWKKAFGCQDSVATDVKFALGAHFTDDSDMFSFKFEKKLDRSMKATQIESGVRVNVKQMGNAIDSALEANNMNLAFNVKNAKQASVHYNVLVQACRE